jgi:hypothetical protein
VSGQLVEREEALVLAGAPMAERCSRAAAQDRREPARIEVEPGVADCIDAAVNPVEASRLRPEVDRRVGDADREQLGTGHEPALRRSKLRYPMNPSALTSRCAFPQHAGVSRIGSGHRPRIDPTGAPIKA